MPLRPFTPADYEGVVRVHNALYPDRPTTAEVEREIAAQHDPRCLTARWVVVEHGEIVGAGQYDQFFWNYHPQHFLLEIEVLPGRQGQGLEAALYTRLMRDLRRYTPLLLRASAREDHPLLVQFWQARGFSERRRDISWQLAVAGFRPEAYAGVFERLRAEGISIQRLDEVKQAVPDWAQQLYALTWDIERDVPGSEDLAPVDFEQWYDESFHSPVAVPGGHIVAVRGLNGDTNGGEIIGLSKYILYLGGEGLYTGMTGVRRAYRGRGIATALKVAGIAFAQAQGFPYIRTDNAMSNEAMQAVNRKLGFRPFPAWIRLEKTF